MIGLRRLACIAALALVLLALWLGSREIRRYVYSRPEHQVDTGRLRMKQLPPWCPEPMRKAMLNKPLVEGVFSIADPLLTEKIAAECKANPWVRKVHFVKKSFPDDIKIDIELRKPLCGVEAGERYVVVDKDAVVLPMSYRNWPTTENGMPVVRGVTSPTPEEGREWNDEAVEGAIETFLAIRDSRKILDRVSITMIDVTNYAGREDPRDSEIIVHTSGNHEILWGRAPNRKCYGELSVREKINTFERLAAGLGPSPGKWDIRFPGGSSFGPPDSM